MTEGAACTTLLAKKYIDNDEPMIANSDQFVEWDSNEFMYSMVADNVDGGILSFEATHLNGHLQNLTMMVLFVKWQRRNQYLILHGRNILLGQRF